MTEAAGAAFGRVEGFDKGPSRLLMTSDNHLADAVAVVHNKIRVAEVHQNHPDFATIICINSAG